MGGVGGGGGGGRGGGLWGGVGGGGSGGDGVKEGVGNGGKSSGIWSPYDYYFVIFAWPLIRAFLTIHILISLQRALIRAVDFRVLARYGGWGRGGRLWRG